MPVDVSKPSVSRIYDFVLGGHHNFEVDRAAAQEIMKKLPSYPRWARFNRWFLQLIAARWAQENRSYILDLGSGLPTQGHFHDTIPTAKVVYTDIDPITVAYATEVLGENSQVTYLNADVRNLQPILGTAEQAFGGPQAVAIGCVGLLYFIDDVSLAQMAKTLHSWAQPGSVLALSFFCGDRHSPDMQEFLESYRKNAAELFLRDEDEMKQLLAPWNVRECKPLTNWLDMDNLLLESDREGSLNFEMYGMLLEY